MVRTAATLASERAEEVSRDFGERLSGAVRQIEIDVNRTHDGLGLRATADR